MQESIKKLLTYDRLYNIPKEEMERQKRAFERKTAYEIEFEKRKPILLKSYISKISVNDLLTKTFETYVCNFQNKKIFAKIKKWKPEDNYGLLLCGKPGIGKSHILKALIGSWASNHIEARFSTLPTILDDLKANLDELEMCVTKYKNVQILAIDDIGAEKTTEWSQDQLTQILDFRITRGKITFGSTNLSESELENRYHHRIVDRLREQMVFVKMGGDTHRKIIQTENHKKWDSL